MQLADVEDSNLILQLKLLTGDAMGRIFERTWWIVGARGLVAVLLGLGALFWPAQTVNILQMLFSIFAIVYGALTLFVELRNPQERQLLPMIKGAAALIIGIATLVWPNISAQILLYLIAAYSLITGVLDIGRSFQLSGDQSELRPYQLGSGIASMVFGIIIILQPLQAGEGETSRNVLIGVYFIVIGVIGMFLAYRVRQAPKPVESAAV